MLETIDRVVSKRKQERENEQTLRAAKSRSKGTDPEKVAKLREEAKQVCIFKQVTITKSKSGVVVKHQRILWF